ncbi:MAG: hypothetical protein ACYTAN_02410 [Planctomycetota bacterium]|jgi:hypothetical protein
MSKYRRPAHSIVEEPKFFIKHWWHALQQWVRGHTDQVLTGLLIVLIAILAVVLWARYRSSTNTEAWARFAGTEGPAALEDAALNYAGTTAGPYLKLKLADYYLEVGRAEDAARLYREVAGVDHADTALRARYSLAGANIASGLYEEGVGIYKDLTAAGGFWGGEAEKALERSEEMREARAHLEELKAAAEAAKAEAAEAEAAEEGEPTAELGLGDAPEATVDEPAEAAEAEAEAAEEGEPTAELGPGDAPEATVDEPAAPSEGEVEDISDEADHTSGEDPPQTLADDPAEAGAQE